MIIVNQRTLVTAMIVFGVVCTSTAHAGGWSEPVEVRHELKRCVSYRAGLNGQFLIIQATHEPGWHTNAMDNRQRAEEKLAGRRSLGIDRPSEIDLIEGLKREGPWYQSPPKDFSKPELRWFSWGFEGQALFVAKVRPSSAGPARIAVRGQACSESACRNIDLEISLPLGNTSAVSEVPDIDLKALIQVR
jgi:hypothetical protein